MANLNFNRTMLGGRLTDAPELKTTQNGTSVLNFTIAVNRRGKDQQADFIKCVAFKERAELIAKFFGKGSSILVVGEIQTRSWDDQNGNKRYATEVIVSEVFFVDSKSDGAPSIQPAPSASANMEELNPNDDLPF